VMSQTRLVFVGEHRHLMFLKTLSTFHSGIILSSFEMKTTKEREFEFWERMRLSLSPAYEFVIAESKPGCLCTFLSKSRISKITELAWKFRS